MGVLPPDNGLQPSGEQLVIVFLQPSNAKFMWLQRWYHFHPDLKKFLRLSFQLSTDGLNLCSEKDPLDGYIHLGQTDKSTAYIKS